jgi:hypothetical protein
MVRILYSIEIPMNKIVNVEVELKLIAPVVSHPSKLSADCATTSLGSNSERYS